MCNNKIAEYYSGIFGQEFGPENVLISNSHNNILDAVLFNFLKGTQNKITVMSHMSVSLRDKLGFFGVNVRRNIMNCIAILETSLVRFKRKYFF